MRKIPIFCAVIIFFLILSACVDTPENLKNEETKADYSGAVSESIQNDEPAPAESDVISKERGTMSDIRNQLAEDLSFKYPNISVSAAWVSEASAMPSYDIKIGTSDMNIDALGEYFFHDEYSPDSRYIITRKVGDPLDKSYPAYSEPTEDPETGEILNANVWEYDMLGYQPDSRDQNKIIVMHSTGFVRGSGVGNSDDYYSFVGEEIIDSYDLDYETVPQDLSYTLADGTEWNATDAINYVETFWKDYLSEKEQEVFTYKVKRFSVLSFDDGALGYFFDIVKTDSNGNRFDMDSSYAKDAERISSGSSFMVPNELRTWCTGKEKITQFLKDFSFEEAAPTDDGNDLLTLKCAADKLSKVLAPNIGLNLKAELCYVAVCKSYPYFQIWKYPAYYESRAIADCDFEIRPFWVFKDDGYTVSQVSDSMKFYVDAKTGELTVMADGEVKHVP